MFEALTDPFAYQFMRNALSAGLLTVIASSLVGSWIVMRGMAFMAEALAHGILPGIAIAFIVGGNLLFGGAVAAAVMIVGISIASSRSRLSEDSSIGLLFVGMLAAGVAIISRRGAYAGDLTAILFGDPIGVTSADLRTSAVAAGVALVATTVLYRPFLVLTFSADKATLLGLHPRRTHYVMLALIAMVVIASFRTVGTLLVVAFLVAPPTTAALISRRVPIMMSVSILVGSLGVLTGLLVSFHAGTATAPTIAGLTVATFFLVVTVKEVVARLRSYVARRSVVAGTV